MDLHSILVPLHLLGFAFGVGGATASDLTFLRTVKDGTVSKDEYNILKTISGVVWASVALLIISGAALLLLQYYQTGAVPRLGYSFFQMKLTAFATLVINGIVFHKHVFPLMRSTIGSSFRSSEIRNKYGLFAFTGAVSITSWYTAFLLAVFGRFLIVYPYLLLLNIYLLLICGGAITAYLVLNMRADEKKTPLHEIGSVYKKPFIVKMVLAASLLTAVLVFQSYNIFL